VTNEELKKIIGRRLISLRKREHWTQQDVADKVGISKSSVSIYENGLRDITADVASELSHLFEVSLNYLFGRSNDDSREAYLAMCEKQAMQKAKQYEELALPVEKASMNGHTPVVSEEVANKAADRIFAAMELLKEGKISSEAFESILKKLV